MTQPTSKAGAPRKTYLTHGGTFSMVQDISRDNYAGTVQSPEHSPPITGGTPLVTGTLHTLEKSSLSGIVQDLKDGKLSTTDALSAANEHFASSGRKWLIPAHGASLANYEASCSDRELSEANKQPFIFPGFSEAGDFYLSRGMTLVGATSGGSKSTTAANLLAGFIKYRHDTTAVVISNEESTDAVIHRTACVLLEKSYMAFHKGDMQARDMQQIRDTARKLLKRIIIVADANWDTTCFEDVTTILESCVPQSINMVLIDYFQTVSHSRLNPDMEHYRVLKMFGKFIREYGKAAPVPVVVFCQLAPTSSAPEFQSRVQHDKTIYNDAFNVVEIKPDFATKLTEFVIHKQRFGVSQGTKVVLRYENGRYVQDGSSGACL